MTADASTIHDVVQRLRRGTVRAWPVGLWIEP
jgi:hypothetical protein